MDPQRKPRRNQRRRRSTPIFRVEVVDHSMSPALAPGDYLIARRTAAVRRGSIVLFRSGTRTMIKRAVGLPGEELQIAGGVIIADGVPLADPWWSAATRPDGVWQLADAEVFVLGDQRTDSGGDSRDVGPIALAAIEGIATARYWPLPRLGRLSPPPRPPSAGGVARRAG